LSDDGPHELAGVTAIRHRVLLFDVARIFPPDIHWAIGKLGSAAAAKLGARADADLLHDQLFSDPRWDRVTRGSDRLLRRQIAEDFAAGRVGSLSGWVLSWTEIRLYALLWLAIGQTGKLDRGPKRKAKPQLVAAKRPGNADAGAKLYAEHCVGCHQPDGGGLGGLTAADLRGAPVAKPAADLAEVVAEGTTSDRGNMPAFGEDLSEAEVADVVAYVKREFGQSAPSR
jgi:mono/diheme cytochrome c family protein